MRILRLLVVVSVVVSSSALPPPGSNPPRKHALLIGIDDYIAVNDLRGCANDVGLMESVLVGKFGFDPDLITKLLDRDATRAQILRKLSDLAVAAKPGDTVVVHYSGHGSRIRDDSQDELDGWDETIVTHDSRTQGVFDITDDEINAALAKITAKTQNVAFIFDSCHSGSITRAAGATVRRVDDDLRTPPPSGRARSVEAMNDFQGADARYVLIMGSRANELSNESDFDGVRHGALTYHLVKALRNATPTTTYRDLMDVVSAEVSGEFPSQHPDLEGLATDGVVFSEGSVVTEPYLLVDPIDATTVRVSGGAVYGLSAGSTIDIHPPGTKIFKPADRVAEARITSVEPFQSEANIAGGAQIERRSRCVVRKRKYADFKLRVHYDPNLPANFATAVQQALNDLSFIEKSADPAKSQLLLVKRDNAALLTSADIADLSPPVALSDADAAAHVADQIVQWSQWFVKLSLDNPDSQLPVTMTIAPDSGPPRPNFSVGDIIKVTVTNNADRNLFFTLIDLSSDGRVNVLHPRAGENDFVTPGNKLTRRFKLTVPSDRPYSVDTFKLFATETPIQSRLFEQEAIRAVDDAALSTNPLARFLESAAVGSRGAEDAPAEGWDAMQQTIRVQADPTRASSFLLHFGPGGADSTGRTRAALRECDPAEAFDPANPCYNIREFTPAQGIAEAVVPAGNTRSLQTVGALWDKAYELRASTGAARVEPAFETNFDWPVEDPISTRGGIQRPDKDGAKNDTIWSLRYINAPSAWDLLHAKGSPDGDEGREVIVGHPDTGYRQHPEIWNQTPAQSPTLYNDGYDFHGNDNDATDPLETGGLLTNPGHGTKSGSVIISPKGKQWPSNAANEFVSGVAPGARIVPLRVHKSVVHFDSTRLAKAIFEAAGDDRTRVKKKASVVSISMGGLPSWALWKAVRFAEKQGVIVVAAAGNEVGFVVWPARFRETIAVAASNVDCGIWEGSSRGSAVDITAPGESVWMAQTDQKGVFSVALGQGTTFATATTAGVAALWLDYHSGEAELERLRTSGELTNAFRTALQTTYWRPEFPAAKKPPGVQCQPQPPWNSSVFGAGIIDAAAALSKSVAAGTRAVVAAEDSITDLPLFRTLFRDTVPLETIRARYHAIFGVTRDADRAEAEALEGELMYHYAADEDLRGLLEAITRDGSIRAEEYAAIRRTLLRLDISNRMRTRLEATP